MNPLDTESSNNQSPREEDDRAGESRPHQTDLPVIPLEVLTGFLANHVALMEQQSPGSTVRTTYADGISNLIASLRSTGLRNLRRPVHLPVHPGFLSEAGRVINSFVPQVPDSGFSRTGGTRVVSKKGPRESRAGRQQPSSAGRSKASPPARKGAGKTKRPAGNGESAGTAPAPTAARSLPVSPTATRKDEVAVKPPGGQRTSPSPNGVSGDRRRKTWVAAA